MVNLPKKSNAGIVDIENIRPITILSCFWRVWAGAYVKSPFVQKRLASLPEEIVAGKGADAQLAASELWGNAQLEIWCFNGLCYGLRLHERARYLCPA